MATVRSNFDLGEFAAELRAREQGYTSLEARQLSMQVANSGRFARKAARKAAAKARKNQTGGYTVS